MKKSKKTDLVADEQAFNEKVHPKRKRQRKRADHKHIYKRCVVKDGNLKKKGLQDEGWAGKYCCICGKLDRGWPMAFLNEYQKKPYKNAEEIIVDDVGSKYI